MHKTSAWPLALIYAALIVFASLFPFDGWREQGISPWVFFSARIPPPYWTWFDVNMNIAGYAPLGFLLALAGLRSGWPRAAVPLAALAGALLSLGMEYLQIFQPRRVPSNMDFALNATGALLGALAAALLERARELGTVAADANPDVAIDMMVGAVTYRVLQPDPPDVDEMRRYLGGGPGRGPGPGGG